MKHTHSSQVGAVLIEALVALVVVAVGTFGVVKLNTSLLSGSGLSKTRAEALQLGQKRIEAQRNLALIAGCSGLISNIESGTVAGVNANYKVQTLITEVTAQKINVDLHIAWDGGATPSAAPADKLITLKTTVSCIGVGTTGLIGGTATTGTGGTLKTPTGVARVGGRDNPPPCTGSCVATTNTTNSLPDNTKVYKTGNLVELVDTVTNKVLLTIEDGSLFSTISGRVYIEASNSGNPIVDSDGAIANDGTANSIADDNVFVVSSDASHCTRIFPTDANSKIPTGSTGNGIKYRYFDYNCYVSKGWWGNIGVIRVDSPNANDRVCVGDPAVSVSETSFWSKKSQFSIFRGYRAFHKKVSAGSDTDLTNFETTGIGVTISGGVSIYAPVNIGPTTTPTKKQHDFLITNITGPDSCQVSGKMILVSVLFTDNQGKYYCTSDKCPVMNEVVETRTTVIHGTIARTGGATLTGIDPADCQGTPTFTDNGSTYTYSCTKIWTGFAGSSWQGGVTFTSTGANTICPNSSGSTPTVLPAGSNVASTVNDTSASVNPNSLSFTDVPLAVTDIIIDFDAHPSILSCPLGTPAPAWPTTTSTTMQALTWSPITNATSYLIKSCTFGNPALSCTPTTPQNIGNLTSYTPTQVISGSVKGFCISVTADSGTSVSVPSGTKCVSGNFSFY